jgi:hypothetical protein
LLQRIHSPERPDRCNLLHRSGFNISSKEEQMARSIFRHTGRIASRGAGLGVLALLFAGAAAAQGGPGSVTVKGHIIDRDSGRPVAGATVTFPDARRHVVTDANGNFIFADLPAGTQTLVIEVAGYVRTERGMELVPGERMVTIPLRSSRAHAPASR